MSLNTISGNPPYQRLSAIKAPAETWNGPAEARGWKRPEAEQPLGTKWKHEWDLVGCLCHTLYQNHAVSVSHSARLAANRSAEQLLLLLSPTPALLADESATLSKARLMLPSMTLGEGARRQESVEEELNNLY
jgi:hypothetical protein